MHVSIESTDETNARLMRVMATAEITFFDGVYAFAELDDVPSADITATALACVRDGARWSCLAPAGATATEPIGVMCVHFPPSADNSGFVGWLATRIKQDLGSGVVVICGSNSERGGIFDYWGFPRRLRNDVRGCVERLTEEGRSANR